MDRATLDHDEKTEMSAARFFVRSKLSGFNLDINKYPIIIIIIINKYNTNNNNYNNNYKYNLTNKYPSNYMNKINISSKSSLKCFLDVF